MVACVDVRFIYTHIYTQPPYACGHMPCTAYLFSFLWKGEILTEFTVNRINRVEKIEKGEESGLKTKETCDPSCFTVTHDAAIE